MDRLRFIYELYPESNGRIDDKSNLTWNNIVFLLGLFEKKIIEENKEVECKYKDDCGHHPCMLTECDEFENCS